MKTKDGIVPVEMAIVLLKNMGGSAIKFFPKGGIKCLNKYAYVAKCCAELDFYLEPTDEIDLDNYDAILKVVLDASVKKNYSTYLYVNYRSNF